jgi:hypothetical protein
MHLRLAALDAMALLQRVTNGETKTEGEKKIKLAIIITIKVHHPRNLCNCSTSLPTTVQNCNPLSRTPLLS